MTNYEVEGDRSVEQRLREEELIERVVSSFDECQDPRLREIMCSLVRHLHSFIRDVRLKEEEWENGINFLTRTGHITGAKRQEFILLSDVLGASMQTIAVNNEAYGKATEATVFGPFFVEGSQKISNGGDMSFGATGERCWVEGTVINSEGEPIAGARIEVWEADEDGLYDVQYADGRVAGRAHLYSDEEGRYSFWGVRPTPYPVPNDGPVGELLKAVGRSPYRPSHLHFMVTADGYRKLVTHIFADGDEFLDGDTVFAVKDSLIKEFVKQEPGTSAPDGSLVSRTWSRVRFEIVLAPVGA